MWHSIGQGLERIIGAPLDSDDLSYFYSAPPLALAQHFTQKYGDHVDQDGVVFLTQKTALDFYQNQVKARSGSLGLVQRLHDLGYRLAVASAAPLVYLEAGLGSAGLTPYFSRIISAADWDMHKSDPGFYLRVCECIGVESGLSWGIDDSAVALKAMRGAGLSTVGIHEPWNESCTFGDLQAIADVAVHEFSELPEDLFAAG